MGNDAAVAISWDSYLFEQEPIALRREAGIDQSYRGVGKTKCFFRLQASILAMEEMEAIWSILPYLVR